MPITFYRFRLTAGYVAHLFKSVVRQDHSSLFKVFRSHLPADGIAIDVGAHGGQFTRLLAGIAYSGLVVAVEPSSYARSILRMALFFRRHQNVLVVAMALGALPGTMLIRTPIKRRGDMGYGLANLVDGGDNFIAEPVAISTLDSLVACLSLPRVDFIKADIEGFEEELMKGATNVLQAMRPVIYMEMDSGFLQRAGSSLNDLWARMTDHGYVPHKPTGKDSSGLPKISQPCAGDILWLPAEKAM